MTMAPIPKFDREYWRLYDPQLLAALPDDMKHLIASFKETSRTPWTDWYHARKQQEAAKRTIKAFVVKYRFRRYREPKVKIEPDDEHYFGNRYY